MIAICIKTHDNSTIDPMFVGKRYKLHYLKSHDVFIINGIKDSSERKCHIERRYLRIHFNPLTDFKFGK